LDAADRRQGGVLFAEKISSRREVALTHLFQAHRWPPLPFLATPRISSSRSRPSVLSFPKTGEKPPPDPTSIGGNLEQVAPLVLI